MVLCQSCHWANHFIKLETKDSHIRKASGLILRFSDVKRFHAFLFYRALELSKNNEKALFRRCQAFEAMGEVKLAFQDARLIHRLYKKNIEILPIFIR